MEKEISAPTRFLTGGSVMWSHAISGSYAGSREYRGALDGITGSYSRCSRVCACLQELHARAHAHAVSSRARTRSSPRWPILCFPCYSGPLAAGCRFFWHVTGCHSNDSG